MGAMSAACAGWRSAASGIIDNSLALFQRYHVDPQDLVVVSGPHIHPAVMKSPATSTGRCWRCRRRTGKTPSGAALPVPSGGVGGAGESDRGRQCVVRSAGFAHLLLRSAGVPEENMEWLGSCTYCTPQRLGSFRRRTHFPAPKSFQYSWIMREPDETK